jgi:hypothetical protein
LESIANDASGSALDSGMESSANGQRMKSMSAWNNEIVNEEEVSSFDSNLDFTFASNTKGPEKGIR